MGFYLSKTRKSLRNDRCFDVIALAAGVLHVLHESLVLEPDHFVLLSMVQSPHHVVLLD